MSENAEFEDPARRRSRAARWLWLLGLMGGLIIVATIVAHRIWMGRVDDQLERAVASLQKKGEPILPADFVVTMPPDADNGWIDLDRLLQREDRDDDLWRQYSDMEPKYPLRSDERQVMQDLIGQSGDITDAVEAASTRPSFVWRLNLSSPVMMNPVPQFGMMRSAADVLGLMVMVEHDAGNDSRLPHRLQSILFLARCSDKNPQLVAHLVATGLGAFAAQSAAEAAPDMKIGAEPEAARPEDVRSLIDALLDDQPAQAGLVRGLRGERMLELDMVRCLLAGTLASPGPSRAAAPRTTGSFDRLRLYVLRPIFQRNAQLMLNHTTALVELAKSNPLTWPAARAALPAPPPRSRANVLVNILAPSLDRALESHYRGVTDGRLAATALAIRWYATEHEGQLPKALDELVPRYLPSVPIDPMSPDESPLRLQLAGEHGPVVYSVSLDGKDDGGSIQPAGRRGDVNEWERLDRVVHLTRQPRPAPEEDEVIEAPEPAATAPATEPSTTKNEAGLSWRSPLDDQRVTNPR